MDPNSGGNQIHRGGLDFHLMKTQFTTVNMF